jgi:uncharacterized membrane protein YciS (DUF1049 family)
MVHQAEVNTNGHAKPREPNVAASFTGLAHDAIELAELQARLLKLDAQAAARNSGIGAALVVVGVCLLLGCVPVALLAFGEWFVVQFDWSRGTAYAAAAAIGLALSAVAATAAWMRVRTALASLQRSRDELNRNLAWIKANLKRDKPTGPTSRGLSERA